MMSVWMEEGVNRSFLVSVTIHGCSALGGLFV